MYINYNIIYSSKTKGPGFEICYYCNYFSNYQNSELNTFEIKKLYLIFTVAIQKQHRQEIRYI